MSEYICEITEYRSSFGESFTWATEYKEPIVRCRDCKRMRDWTAEEELASYDKEELADGWCTFFRIGTYDDFFCAWGKRKVESE